MLALYEVIDKMHADDRFVRPFASFDAVKQGEQIGVRHDGAPVLAAEDGCIVFPTRTPRWGRSGFTWRARAIACAKSGSQLLRVV